MSITSKQILLVSYEFPPHMPTGGIGTYMYHLGLMLSGKGYSVTVFSATQTHTDVTVVKTNNYLNYLIPCSDILTFKDEALQVFNEYIKDHYVDIIESPEVGACALRIKEDYPLIPLIVRLHTPGVVITKISNTYQPLLTKLRYVFGALRRGKLDLGYWSKKDKNRMLDPEYNICILADQLVSPSHALADYISLYWQLEKEIIILPNPFYADTDLFKYPLEGREKLICFIGKLSVLKGMFALTKAVKLFLKKHPDYRFVFVGRDESVSKIIPSMKAWIEKELKDVIEKVEFTDALSREEVKILLGRSRVCVVPSLWENYPNVILEAMASGVAVAASNRGGIPELIANSTTGYLFNPLLPSEIDRAINELLSSDQERFQITAAARYWVQSSQMEVEERILGLYESILKNSTYASSSSH